MSGVGFTVFQVPGSRAAKKVGAGPAPRLGGLGAPSAPSSSSSSSAGAGAGGPAPASALSGPAITTSIIHSVAEPYQPAALPSSGSYSSVSSSGSATARGQRNSTSGFSAFQPQTAPHQHQVSSATSSGSATTFTAFGAGLGSAGGFSAGVAPTPTVEEARGGIGWMRTGRVIRVKETGESYRFPLDEEHLPRVRATAAQYAALREKLERVADKYVGNAATWMENPTLSSQYRNQSWKAHVDKKNCVVYRQKTSDSASLARKAIVRAKLDTTLEEVEYALYCDNTNDLRAYMAHCYQESFLDAAVLQVAKRAVPADPLRFLGIKWLVFQSSVDSVFSCRDALLVEFSKTYEDPKKGHKVLVRVAQSVDPRDLDAVQEKNFGFSRTSETTVTLFRSMGPSSGKVDVAMYSDMLFEAGKATPAWLANRVVSTLFHVVTNHATCADAKFLVKSRLITDKAWVPNNERPACSVCFKSFNLLRSRHHCRVCAEIMCSPCTMELGVQASKLPVGMLPDTSGGCVVSVEKFCLKCINKARQERRSAIARAADFNGSSSMGSNGGMATSCETDDGEAVVPASYAGRESEMYYADETNGGGSARGSLSDMPGFYDSMPNGGNNGGNNGGYHQSQSFASVSSNSSAGSGSGIGLGGGSAGGEKSGISYAGWSTKVLSAINREKPSESGSDASISSLTGSTGALNINGGALRSAGSSNALLRSANERRRQNSDASQTTSVSSQSERGSSSVSSELRWDGREAGGLNEPITLVEEDPDVMNVTPLPTSFTKMEEQIAAQQALLRSMFLEGQKIMQQKQTHTQYINQMHPQQQYLGHQSVGAGPVVVLEDDASAPQLAMSPPPSAPATSIESID